MTQLYQLAYESTLFEVNLPYKPGLVDPLDNGSHIDMDVSTFIASSNALLSHFKEYETIGRTASLNNMFCLLRHQGQIAEKDMFIATNQINTHKGLNFMMAIVLAACSYCEEHKLQFEDIQSIIKIITKDILSDFEQLKNHELLSHGEKLYINHQIKGIRHEAYTGFDLVFKKLLPLCQNNPSEMAFYLILLTSMSELEDTTILHRSNHSGLHYVQAYSKNVLEHIKKFPDTLMSQLLTMNDDFKQKNISPGGSADYLALTHFLCHAQRFFSLKRRSETLNWNPSQGQ